MGKTTHTHHPKTVGGLPVSNETLEKHLEMQRTPLSSRGLQLLQPHPNIELYYLVWRTLLWLSRLLVSQKFYQGVSKFLD